MEGGYCQTANGTELRYKSFCDKLMSSCRIPWGAIQASEYLLKIVQMKYPYFLTRVTPQQSAVRIAPHPIDVPLSQLFPVDAPNFLRILARLSRHFTPIK